MANPNAESAPTQRLLATALMFFSPNLVSGEQIQTLFNFINAPSPRLVLVLVSLLVVLKDIVVFFATIVKKVTVRISLDSVSTAVMLLVISSLFSLPSLVSSSSLVLLLFSTSKTALLTGQRQARLLPFFSSS